MTRKNKHEIIDQICNLLAELKDDEPVAAPAEPKPLELLTIKECTEVVKGLSEHTVRKLVAQNRIRYIRTGEGERGKILISKQSLLDYMGGVV